ncbi:Cytochrome c-553 (modular protein) [Sulfurovum sp. enrichment culture clone C5]|uniref:Cytochrome c-553 (Modular protein) n=1 Tax=Sulfurovum sp. enrichment culture clone C5 TaxID=497650 RepID=A0A0S4XMW0_9BACT|nr:Cytochrome c-553 (modular protein) [Sulfurovum sp. enrichment culture clone C5]
MKKMTLLSVAVAALLFVGCGGDKPAEANTTDANVTVEANATEANATEATTEANATEANTTAAAPAAAVDGAAAYATCSACHGADGKGTVGGAKVLAGFSAADIDAKLHAYKAGSVQSPTAAIMNAQAANLNDDQIKALADYISKL